jgi:uncharacterized protein (DUF2336 family)
MFDEDLMSGGADARKELARQLSKFLIEDREPSPKRDVAIADLVKLATDPVFEVRQSVAEFLCSAAPLESDLMFTIIADEDEIALPFLASSPAIGLPEMLAVLKAGDMLRRMQIAARHDLFEDCADYIIGHCDWQVCAALLDNPVFEPRETDYRTIYGRFPCEPQIVDRLLSRHDIPLDIRILQAKQASSRIENYLQTASVNESDLTELVANAEELATLEVLARASESELDEAIPFLLNKHMLTSSLIVRAAVVGEMRIVERALAVLSGLLLKRVQGLLYQRGLFGARAIFKRCGLAASCARVIQAAAEVERNIRENGHEVSSNGFGVRVVETILTRFDSLSLDEKLQLITYVENFGTERPRAVACKLKLSFGRSGVIAA